MQKKAIFGLLLSLLLVAQLALAQTPQPLPDECVIRADPARAGITGCPSSGPCNYSAEGGEQCGICCIISTVLYVTDWFFVFLVVLVLALVLIGAFNILTAAGDAAKITAGRNYILWAAIGLAVALLSRAIPALVRFLIAPTATTA